MNIQLPILDEINTGLISIYGVTYFDELNSIKAFHSKRMIFDVVSEPNNTVDRFAIKFLFNEIPVGYMIREHASIYNRHIRLWEYIKYSKHGFSFYAEMQKDPKLQELELTVLGKKITKTCYPITIYTKKD